MSDTTTTPPATAPKVAPASESLKSPQFIISMYAMTIVAGIVAYTLLAGDAQEKAASLTLAITLVTGVLGYYLGSSQSSQKKDEKTTP